MRVCFDARAIRPEMTGVGVYCDRLLREMIRLGQIERPDGAPEKIEWTLIHLPGAPLGEYDGLPGVTLLETGADYGDHPSGEIWLNLALPKILKQRRIDLLHGPAYLLPWRPVRAIRVVTVHDMICDRLPHTFPARFAWYMRRVTRWSCRAADGVVVNSECTGRDVHELTGVGRDKIRVTLLAADPKLAPAGEEEVRRVRRAYGLEGDYLLYVGSIEPRKGLGAMIDLIERFARSGRPVQLALAGKLGWRTGPLLQRLENSPAGDHIRRLEYVPDSDLPALYTGATATLYLSLYEGFGLPALEAMACGSPILASNRASIPEVTGSAAALVEPEDVDEAYETLCRWLDDPAARQAAVKAGLDRVRLFSWEKTARKTLEFYGELARKVSLSGGA